MAASVLVFISHASEDKEALIEPLVRDLEDCYISVWLDKRRIVPGDNLRQSIFRDGLDKSDVTLVSFTENSLKSSWVDREIKHVLRENSAGADFNLRKIISIFDSEQTYRAVHDRYPELTDDLLHLMPPDYSSVQLGQLISAIWSKYVSLQASDMQTQRLLLAKDQEILAKDQALQHANSRISELEAAAAGTPSPEEQEYRAILASGVLGELLARPDKLLGDANPLLSQVPNAGAARAFGLLVPRGKSPTMVDVTAKGLDFFRWAMLNRTP